MVPCGSGAVATIAWSADSKHIVAVCDKSEAPPGSAAPETTVLQCSPAGSSPTPITTGPGSVNAIVWTLDGEHVVSTDRGQHLVRACLTHVPQESCLFYHSKCFLLEGSHTNRVLLDNLPVIFIEPLVRGLPSQHDLYTCHGQALQCWLVNEGM